MVLVPAGPFRMGTQGPDSLIEDGEGPVREVTLDAFMIDGTAVTNAAFSAFVQVTGHVTEAERQGSSYVFHAALHPDAQVSVIEDGLPRTPWWLAVHGAGWIRQPIPGATTCPPAARTCPTSGRADSPTKTPPKMAIWPPPLCAAFHRTDMAFMKWREMSGTGVPITGARSGTNQPAPTHGATRPARLMAKGACCAADRICATRPTATATASAPAPPTRPTAPQATWGSAARLPRRPRTLRKAGTDALAAMSLRRVRTPAPARTVRHG